MASFRRYSVQKQNPWQENEDEIDSRNHKWCIQLLNRKCVNFKERVSPKGNNLLNLNNKRKNIEKT
jgi:hypothetical protein